MGAAVAAFTHEGLIKTLLGSVLDVQFGDRRLTHDNCAYSVFTFTGDQGWKLLRWNVPSLISDP